MIKAFSYLRVSGLSQVDGDGFPRQRAAILDFAAKNGFEIVEEFVERGVSGKTEMDSRPALGALLAALEANGVKTIVVEKIDRLARDLMISESIIGDLQRKGYTLISTMEPDLCSTDPSRVFIRQVFGALAQLDRATLTAKMKAAKERKRKADPTFKEGRKPYGHYAGEGVILASMIAMRESGATFQQIADKMNAEGKMSRSGRPWKVGSVGKILTR